MFNYIQDYYGNKIHEGIIAAFKQYRRLGSEVKGAFIKFISDAIDEYGEEGQIDFNYEIEDEDLLQLSTDGWEMVYGVFKHEDDVRVWREYSQEDITQCSPEEQYDLVVAVESYINRGGYDVYFEGEIVNDFPIYTRKQAEEYADKYRGEGNVVEIESIVP